ncbi:hypothetical protein CSW98_15110 [Vibrio sp. HA2012]|uniref:hypothetical protein n=1 Tax=Vibrio sp. HA2012 TaxID=1971595 RepID=UPI000C2B537E|nr:hypothetical protein [Vibrio sp. HA2012]PJC85513.1 hypothetical protein CSW98_15110 [Vibrio sp. HA2012]
MKIIKCFFISLCFMSIGANAAGAWNVVKGQRFATSSDVTNIVTGVIGVIPSGGYTFGMRVVANGCDAAAENRTMTVFVNKEIANLSVGCNANHTTYTPVTDLDNEKIINVFKNDPIIYIGTNENDILIFQGDGFTETLNNL